jgi:hypothetical protein
MQQQKPCRAHLRLPFKVYLQFIKNSVDITVKHDAIGRIIDKPFHTLNRFFRHPWVMSNNIPRCSRRLRLRDWSWLSDLMQTQRNSYPIYGENTDGPFQDVRSYQSYPTLIDTGRHVVSIPHTGNNAPITVSSIDLLGVNNEHQIATHLSEERTSVLNPLRRSRLALTRLP